MAADEPITLQQWLNNIPVPLKEPSFLVSVPLPRGRRISWADTSGSLLEEVRLVSPLPHSAYVPSPDGQVPPITLPPLPALGDPAWQAAVSRSSDQSPQPRSGDALFRAVENFVKKNNKLAAQVSIFSTSVHTALQNENKQPAFENASRSFSAGATVNTDIVDKSRAFIGDKLKNVQIWARTPENARTSKLIDLPLEKDWLNTSHSHSYVSLHKQKSTLSRHSSASSAAKASSGTMTYSRPGHSSAPSVPFMPNRHARWQSASTVDSLAKDTHKVIEAGFGNRSRFLGLAAAPDGGSTPMRSKRASIASSASSTRTTAQQGLLSSSRSVNDSINTATIRRSVALTIRPLPARVCTPPQQSEFTTTVNVVKHDHTPQATIKALLREGVPAVLSQSLLEENPQAKMRITPRMLQPIQQTPTSKLCNSALFAQVVQDLDVSRNLQLEAAKLLHTPSVTSSFQSTGFCAEIDANVEFSHDAQTSSTRTPGGPASDLSAVGGDVGTTTVSYSPAAQDLLSPHDKHIITTDNSSGFVEHDGQQQSRVQPETPLCQQQNSCTLNHSNHFESPSDEIGTFLEDCIDETCLKSRGRIPLVLPSIPRQGILVVNRQPAVSRSPRSSAGTFTTEKRDEPLRWRTQPQRNVLPGSKPLHSSGFPTLQTPLNRGAPQRPVHTAAVARQSQPARASTSAAKCMVSSLNVSRQNTAAPVVSKPATLSTLIYAKMKGSTDERTTARFAVTNVIPLTSFIRTEGFSTKRKTQSSPRKPCFLVNKSYNSTNTKVQERAGTFRRKVTNPSDAMNTPKKSISILAETREDATLTPATRFVRKLVATVSKTKPTWK
jgi:hypothetical protein